MAIKSIKLDKEIRNAIKNKKPIVALESSLISHGLPYPQNMEIAKKSIKLIRSSGSIPATIGIIDGNVKVGLNDDEIKILATNKIVEKVSRNNIALSMFKNKCAATTVASSIMIASLVGIKIFSTGGIGGVHRNSELTYDISSDLIEFEKNNIIVVSSGAKSILDIFKTNEMLETLGITKIGYRTNKVPGFWSQKTKLEVDCKINKVTELIEIIKNRKTLNQNGCLLLYNPVQKKYSINNFLIEKWIKIANKKAKKNNIIGKKLTPYLLKEISLLSNGLTMQTNTSLILNNAKLAGKVAYNINKILWK